MSDITILEFSADADFEALAAEQARLENIIQASDAHNLEHQLEIAADALRPSPGLFLRAWAACAGFQGTVVQTPAGGCARGAGECPRLTPRGCWAE